MLYLLCYTDMGSLLFFGGQLVPVLGTTRLIGFFFNFFFIFVWLGAVGARPGDTRFIYI
jgi:hypothetical protein